MEDPRKIKARRKARYGDGGKAVKIRTETNGLRPLKMTVIALAVILQVALLIFLNVMAGVAIQVYMVISFTLSFITCIYCLSSPRNGLSKAVWVMILTVGYSFGFIIYILSDERFFFRKAKKRYNAVFERTARYVSGYVAPKANRTVAVDCKYLYSAGGFKAYTGTRVKYFPSGAQLFDDVLERLESAKNFVFMEFFIISDGVLLDRIAEMLARKVKEGVTVRIIYDDMGCKKTLSHKMKSKLLKAGVNLTAYNRIVPLFNVALNYRDHRKIIVIDGKTAYTGGSNLADEYVNEKRMYGYWKDTGIRLDGEGVDGFTLAFLRQWEYIKGREEPYSQYLNLSDRYENECVAVPFTDGLDYKQNIGKSVYENIISGAKDKLWIMTPYFIPDEIIAGLLKNKAEAGVDVRIILPAIPDKVYAYIVSRNNAEKLISSGVKVYCMEHSFVHSKLCISENCAVVGSINFDLRSFYQQFESAVYTNDVKAIEEINADFENTFGKCTLIDEKNGKRAKIYNRILAGVLQIVAPLM